MTKGEAMGEHVTPATRPPSDVSGAVGLVGLIALLAWLWLCRSWAGVSLALGLPGPHAPMSGPYAALAALVVTGSAMSLWSLLVDKVHRNPSTGIDWALARPLCETLDISITKLAGLWATWAGIGLFYCIARWYWDGQYLFAMEVIGAAAIPVFLLSIPYVLWLDRKLVEPRDYTWHFGALLIGREAWEAEQVRKHWRAWAIKGFFGAFMISILPGGFAVVVGADLAGVVHDPVAAGSLLIQLLFLIDVQIGTVGYLFTFRPLDSHIRSGNPYLAAWVAALICYPPIVWGTIGRPDVLGYEAHTGGWAYWLQGHDALLWLWSALMAGLTGFYAWATFAFGLRFSNLTYRGVLTNGPYRFTRHPAYLSKNLFWWLSTLPFLVTNGSFTDMVRNTVLLGVVSAIYFWRAKTEERHLLAEDAKYREYHAWMAHNAPITRAFSALWTRFAPRSPQVPAPAE
ncbi:protein-S-isoprenylcysteine methyltransferase [Novosphingobium sp. 1949]|uniref:Protein-S-isoprenylcysteine methyltransferase n=1 Tax=Novosphingobium organovorum TaxID=2930092 RepID=A0ABT0BHM7_9SPHN|nr:isoprenylcysteine carboxylmethyltransferase family protein [Novosphingobium organovorum]MCJ2184573.1 protein-S-isoprenylcysteine methyltransferase [Novosphingobium organovorum]